MVIGDLHVLFLFNGLVKTGVNLNPIFQPAIGFIKQDNLSVSKEEAEAEAKALAAAQFAQYGMPSAPDDMLAGYAGKILADKEQGQKIYEKLYEMKVVEDVKSKITVEEKSVSADEFAKLAQELR